MKTRTLHKALSMLLTAAMIFNMGLTPVFAAEGTTPPGVSGVCTHHTEHTADCGYKQGAPCTHEHTEDCSTKELTCALVEGDAPEIATDSEATLDSGNAPVGETHTHGEGCYTKTDNCKHEHDEACGYTPDSPCTFDAASCTECNTGDKPAEKVCTCPPVDSGEPVHGKDCPLYTAPELSEAVKALIAMVDALPNPEDITKDNKEATLPAFEAALTAYEALSGDDKVAFEATEQYKKLMALHTALYSTSLMTNEATWDMKDGTLTLDNTCGADCTHTITGTSTGGTIIVQSGTHNITLSDVTIDVNGTEDACAFEIKGGATVNLTLTGTNTLQSGKYKAGLQVPQGNTLTITAISTGSLTATGGERSAGIGGGRWGAGGTVNINGGTVNATGGDYGAGIGGGYDGAGGNITISGGTVTATGGYGGAGIGGGDRGASGNITIEGNAVVFATKGVSATNHIGAGVGGADGTVNKNGGIIFEGISGLLYGTSVTPTGSFTMPSTHMLTIKSGQTLTIDDDIVVTNDGIILNEGTIHGTITGNPPVVPNAATHDIGTGTLILDSTCGGGTCNGHTVTGNTTTYKIIVESGTHNVTLDGVAIDVSATDNACAFEIKGGATVNLTLEGVNTLKSGKTRAGLEVATGNTLTITAASNGSLTATGGDYGAGIGGGSNGAGGNITISSGEVTATGGDYGAGIGGGSNGAGGNITISSGEVTATGGDYGAGIGGGNWGAGGTVSISGGTVAAIGGDRGAGIGGGNIGAGGTVTISGGTVTATGGSGGAGIGGGNLSNADGIITIDGNTVVFATKGTNAASHIGTKGTVNKTNGIIFEGASGTVYGGVVTPTDDFTIPPGHILTIASGQTVDVSGITATNNGAIKNEGTIRGAITGNQPNESGNTVTLDISGADKYVKITASGYKVGTAITETAYAGDYIITGTATGTNASSNHVTVSGGTHNITLKDAAIQLSANEKSAFSVEGSSTVNLTLTGANTLKSGDNRAGLQVSNGNTLNIKDTSTGSLTATGGQYSAGIGGGRMGAGGTVNINGGTVNATGGNYGAGIGGGSGGAGGSITISNPAVVFATKGDGATNHIGAGKDGADGTVSKNGGIIFEGTSGLLYGASVAPTGSFTIPTAHMLTIKSGQALTIHSGITVTNNGIILNEGNIHGTITGNPPIVPNAATHDIGTGALILNSTCGGGACNGHAVTGNTTTHRIMVESGTHNVTLNGVTINVSATENACAFEIKGGATVNLTLEGVNTLKSGSFKAGLQVTVGNTLTIAETSNGSLTATGGQYSAGIGGGAGGAGGTSEINGGTVTATGGENGAGIGGGRGGAGGTITIDGNAVVYAAKGAFAPNHIGAGFGGTDGTVTKTRGIIFEGAVGKVYGNVTLAGNLTIAKGETLVVETGTTLTIPAGITLQNDGAIFCSGTINGRVSGNPVSEMDAGRHFIATGDLLITGDCAGGCKGHTVVGATNSYRIVVSGGTHNITLKDTSIQLSGDGNKKAFSVEGNSTVNLTLDGTNLLQGGYECVGLEVSTGNTLTITDTSTGSLTATGGDYSAGIGGGDGGAGGTISISGGTVNATGGYNGAGIGGGIDGAGGTISISGGTVNATGGGDSAGIGGGSGGAGGTISISGGTVNATGGYRGAGIGGGSFGAGGTISISGGTVNATGGGGAGGGGAGSGGAGSGGAGIGSGGYGAGGTITIDGNAVVYAKKGFYAPNHIGAGYSGADGTVAKTRGIIFEGETGTLYGNVTLGQDAKVKQMHTLTIGSGRTLEIGNGVTLTNNGTLAGTGFVGLLSRSARVDGSGTGNDTHVKRLLVAQNTAIANTRVGTLPVVTWDGIAITADTDFTISDFVAGTSVPVTVTGTGNYRGSVTKSIAVEGSGGGSGGGGNPTPTPPSENKPDPKPPVTEDTNAKTDTDKEGNVTAKADDKEIANAIEKAQKADKGNGIAITLNVKTDKNAKSLVATISAATITALTNAKVTQLTINNGITTITLDLAALNALKGGDVVITVTKVDVKTLSAEAQNAIGNRPVFRFGVTVGGKAVSDFKGGRVGLQMPYTRTIAEQAGNLVGVYVDGSGKVTWQENSSYDSRTGTLLTSTTHFSVFGVGYKATSAKFTDVGTHWAKNDIDFVVARGLLSGTSNTTFAPDTSMTRGMFVTALGRLAGVDTTKYSNTKFTDVAATAYYSPYVAWANANNIVTGTSDTTFSPDKAITRQEMAVMLVNYSKAIGYKLPSVHTEVTFTDAGSIASWAKDAVKQTQMAGILMGKSGNRFDPTATATRAEVSAMLRRYVELVVNTETAEGWAMNESGQWLYIQDGKRVTGNKTIDGKSYTFDQDGVTTALPPERKYLAYTVQAGDSFWSIARKYKVSMFELAAVNGKTIFSVIHVGDELKVPQK